MMQLRKLKSLQILALRLNHIATTIRNEMNTVDDIEEIKDSLKNIFPDAIRGSVAKSHWGKGRKQLHLCYFIGSDTVGGYIIEAKGELFYFIDWDSNMGHVCKFAESSIYDMVKRVKKMFKGKKFKIAKTVKFPNFNK